MIGRNLNARAVVVLVWPTRRFVFTRPVVVRRVGFPRLWWPVRYLRLVDELDEEFSLGIAALRELEEDEATEDDSDGHGTPPTVSDAGLSRGYARLRSQHFSRPVGGLSYQTV